MNRRRSIRRGDRPSPGRLVDRLAPTWGGTNLGQALVDTVAAIEDVADTSEKAGRMPRRVVLISDLAQGSRLDAAGRLRMALRCRARLEDRRRHGFQRGPRAAGRLRSKPSRPRPTRSRRVRVVNNPGSEREKFELHWIDEKGAAAGKPIDVYVPPGESRVVRVPRPAGEFAARRRSG